MNGVPLSKKWDELAKYYEKAMEDRKRIKDYLGEEEYREWSPTLLNLVALKGLLKDISTNLQEVERLKKDIEQVIGIDGFSEEMKWIHLGITKKVWGK